MSLLRGVSYQLIAQAIMVGAALGAVPIVSRHLGVDGYGVFVTVMAFCAMFSAISDLGLGVTTVREIAAQRLLDGEGVATAVVVRGLNVIWVVLGGIAVAIAMGQPQAVVVGIAVSAGYVLVTGTIAVGPNVIIQLRNRFRWLAVAAAAQACVWIGGIAVVLVADLDVVGVIIALTLSALAALIVSTVAARRVLVTPLRFRRAIAVSLVRQSVSLGIASLLAMAYYRLDAIVLAAMVGTGAAGLYGAAYRFLDQPRLIASYIGTAGHAAVARAAVDGAEFQVAMARMVRTAIVVGVFATVVLFVFAEPLVGLLFGAQFGDAPPLLRVLSLAALPLLLNGVVPYALIAKRRQIFYVWINLAAALFNLTGNILLIPLFGPMASAWLTVATECLVLCSSFAAVWWVLRFVPGTTVMRQSRAKQPA